MTVDLEQAALQVQMEEYFNLPGTTVTICNLTAKSGFQVRGESACKNPARFNEEDGRKLAREKALGRLAYLESYRLSFEGAK